jgi:hypothetical protein
VHVAAHRILAAAAAERLELVEQRLDQRHQDLRLAGEVVVERGLGHAELLGEVAHRGARVSVLGEQLAGGNEDACPRVDRR